jgi:hypothetical protein
MYLLGKYTIDVDVSDPSFIALPLLEIEHLNGLTNLRMENSFPCRKERCEGCSARANLELDATCENSSWGCQGLGIST